tara:strand:- start:62 stop:304 length:243 start_codon:yes stop_codon:yes gene_type:complete
MKESKLIQMSKQLEALKKVTQQLIKEIQINATMAGGTLEAFKVHVGKEEWELIVEELKDKEKRNQEQDKKLDLDVEQRVD